MEAAERSTHRPAQYAKREVRLLSPESLLKRIPAHVDFLSVDAEGMDIWIMTRLLELGLRPRLMMCEIDKVSGDEWMAAFGRLGYRELHRSSANSVWALS
jgi:hypothetical protein